MKHFPVPQEVARVTKALEDADFEAYIVGGCVRDLLLGRTPKDWDVATSAPPPKILEVFEHANYDNEYGTVRVVNDDTEDPVLKVIEVTTFRKDGNYSDGRRPDEVIFSTNLEDDLARRDFTINALAGNVTYETNSYVTRENIVDLYGGLDDLDKRVIRAVGDPKDRIQEDALRIMRAVRIATELGFALNSDLEKAIRSSMSMLKNVAWERIREEFIKLIMSDSPKKGLEMCHELGILSYILPELEENIGTDQNQAHAYTVWEHLLRSAQAAADKGWPLHVRLASLFHDIAKTRTRAHDKEKNDWSFHGHEVVGTRVTREIMKRFAFSRETSEKVTKLVRWHMFFSDPDQITLSAVRRMIRNVGEDLIWDLMNIRVADRIGTGRPKEKPYRFRKYQSMVEEALRDPISVGKLAIDGEKVMNVARETPGPRIGWILHALLEEVLDDPSKNTEDYLVSRVTELAKLDDSELRKLGKTGQKEKERREEEEIQKLRKKYHVR